MPLIKGKSDKAFGENVRTEMHHGHPLKQSLAIAYSMKRKAQKKAHGGEMCAEGCDMLHEHNYASGGHIKGVHVPELVEGEEYGIGGQSHAGRALEKAGKASNAAVYSNDPNKSREHRSEANYHREDAKAEHEHVLKEMKSMRNKDRKYLADGGEASEEKPDNFGHEVEPGDSSPSPSPSPAPSKKQAAIQSFKKAFKTPPKIATGDDEGYAKGGFVQEEQESGYLPMPKPGVEMNPDAMRVDDRMLNQHGEDERGPESMMEDSEHVMERIAPHAVENQHDREDMVGHIIKKRNQKFSKGGRVANDVGMGASADLEDNQFDDLVLRDDLEQHYTGANSGDEIGNAGEDARRRDVVSAIMMSRRKKDRLPRPA